MNFRDEIHEALHDAAQAEARRIRDEALRGPRWFQVGLPTEFAPSYVEHGNTTVHVITTLEERAR